MEVDLATGLWCSAIGSALQVALARGNTARVGMLRSGVIAPPPPAAAHTCPDLLLDGENSELAFASESATAPCELTGPDLVESLNAADASACSLEDGSKASLLSFLRFSMEFDPADQSKSFCSS